MAQARKAPIGNAQAKRLVTGIGQRHSVAEAAMVMMILRALFVMSGIAGFPRIVMMLRMTIHGGDDLAGIHRECTSLKPGAHAQ